MEKPVMTGSNLLPRNSCFQELPHVDPDGEMLITSTTPQAAACSIIPISCGKPPSTGMRESISRCSPDGSAVAWMRTIIQQETCSCSQQFHRTPDSRHNGITSEATPTEVLKW